MRAFRLLVSLTGLAAITIVESGCATFGPQIIYDKGAPSIISEWQDMYNAAGQRRSSPHPGIDIEGPIGHSVLVPADGEIEFMHYDNIGGYVIRIYHGKNKEGKHVVTGYSHLTDSHVNKLKVGQKVKRGEQIAEIGMTGSSITLGHPHLHFLLIEISDPNYLNLETNARFWAGWREDPKKYLPRLNPGAKDEKILVECFMPGKTYNFSDIIFTYPVKCGK